MMMPLSLSGGSHNTLIEREVISDVVGAPWFSGPMKIHKIRLLILCFSFCFNYINLQHACGVLMIIMTVVMPDIK